ncbi:hypothetical protein, partial [Sediminicola arcticus]
TPQVIDTRANSNPYTPTSGLISTDVQGALDELAASNAADNDTDTTNEIQTLTSADGSVTLTPSGNDYDLSVAAADGSETIVTGAGINVVMGTGTTADPYIITATEVDGSITNEVNTAFAVNGANLEITDANSTLSVPLSSLGTDDQNLNLVGDILSIEDGNNVDLASYLDNTDDQIVTDFSMDASNILTITLEDGNTQTVDLSSLNNNGTDNQALSLAGNILTLEDGGTVDLSPYLDNIDNQQISLSGNILTLGNGTGVDTTVDLSGYISTDDQALTLAAGNILTLEDGGMVDLTSFLDNTDNQQITTFSLDNTTDVLTLTLEDGGTQTVDFSTVLAAADNQQLTLAAGNILTLEDGGTVDLTSFLDNTDDQQITTFSLDNTTDVLTLT